MKKFLLNLLAIGLLFQTLSAQNAIEERTLRLGNESHAAFVAAAGNNRWLVAGESWTSKGVWFEDTIFVATLDDAGGLVSLLIPDMPPAEAHFTNQLLALPGGDFILNFESTLCDVAYDIATMRRYKPDGTVVWELQTNLVTGEHIPRRWRTAPDGNLIGLLDTELWKVNVENGDVMWKTILFDYQASGPKINWFEIVPGTENLLGLGSPTLSLWRQHGSGSAVSYTPDSALYVPDFYSGTIEAGPDGWFYVLDRYKGLLLRTKTDLQYQNLAPQSAPVLDFALDNSGLYFLARSDTSNQFYKTNFDGTSPQNLNNIEPLIFPRGLSIGNGRVIVGGADGSGPNSRPGGSSPTDYTFFEVNHAWARTVPLLAPTLPLQADAGVSEVKMLLKPDIDSFEIQFDPFVLYNITGGDYQVKITNYGSTTLDQVWVNQRFEVTYPTSICPRPEIKAVRYDNLNLAPGQSTWVNFGDIRGSNQAEVVTDICFWTSGPNDLADVQKDNDHACSALTVAAPEPKGATPFRVFPNPVTDGLLFVKMPAPTSKTLSWRLSDALGRNLRTGELPAGQQQWPISTQGLPAGMYFLSMGDSVLRVLVTGVF